MDAVAEAEEAVTNFTDLTPERLRAAAANIVEAHKEAIEHGLFHFSEVAYLRYELDFDAETVDYVAGSGNEYMWLAWEPYFSATNWLTVDKGLDWLPRAAYPHLQDRLTWSNETQQIAVNWREDPFDMDVQSEDFNYAIVTTAPFTRVRTWKRPQFSSLLTRAIDTMNYQQACKVAMHFKTRFWEKLDPPIYGGCGGTDIYGLGGVCYPSYEINSSRPGVLHASYTSGTPARALAAMSDDEHIAFVLRSMVEIHGQIAAEEYAGHHGRQCWEVDEHQVGGWAFPTVGQQELYLPAPYETQYNTIFAGEHTTITHGWLFSALDAATHATTQLLLELGLVDEAKQIVEEWMGRWIKI